MTRPRTTTPYTADVSVERQTRTDGSETRRPNLRSASYAGRETLTPCRSHDHEEACSGLFSHATIVHGIAVATRWLDHERGITRLTKRLVGYIGHP